MNADRVLIWYWSGGGGGSQFAVRLAHKLASRFGDDAVTLSLRSDDSASVEAALLGLTTRPADIRSDRRRPLMTAAQLLSGARILNDLKPGASHGLDVICNGILNAAPFVA